MKNYVMLFRATRALTPEELQKRPGEIRHWIVQVNALGIKLDPRNLGETAMQYTPKDGNVVTHEGIVDKSLITLVFFDAPDDGKALEVARLHPAPHYGIALELRDWNHPQAPLGPPQ
jgi:hypothetical protein